MSALNAWLVLLERLLSEGKGERDLLVLSEHLKQGPEKALNLKSLTSQVRGDWRWMPAWCAIGRNQSADSLWFEKAVAVLLSAGASPSDDFERYGIDEQGNACLDGPCVKVPLLVGLVESNANPKALLPLLQHHPWFQDGCPDREGGVVRLIFACMGGLRFDKPQPHEIAPFVGALVKAAPAVLASPWAEKIWERGLLQGEDGNGHGILRQMVLEGLEGRVLLERSGVSVPAWMWAVLDKTFIWWTLSEATKRAWDPNQPLPGGKVAGDWLANRVDPSNVAYVISSLNELRFDWLARRPSNPLGWLASYESQARQAMGNEAYEALMASGRAQQLEHRLALVNESDETVRSRL